MRRKSALHMNYEVEHWNDDRVVNMFFFSIAHRFGVQVCRFIFVF